MSIIIKTEELNYLIYAYFLEQGFTHSAFTLFNEVKIDPAKFQADVRPGHLIYLLEKALLFTQIHDHIQLNQYFECRVPVGLISKHVCQFAERRQLNEKAEKLDRELIIQNAYLRSQEIIGRNGATIDQPVELPPAHDIGDEITLFDWNPQKALLAVYQQASNCIKFFQNFQMVSLLPALIGESPSRIRLMKFDRASGQYLLVVFETGTALISDYQGQIIKMFAIKHKVKDLYWNPNWPNVAALMFEKSVEVSLSIDQIVDIFKLVTLYTIENCQLFEWRFYDEFVAMDPNFYVNLHRIDSDRATLQLKAEMETTSMEFNKSKTLLATFSSSLNNLKVWTLQSEEYVFEISDEQKIMEFCWCSSQNANYLITQTTSALNIWDVEFGQIKCTFEVDARVLSMTSLEMMADSPQVVLMLPEKKLIIFDLLNRKRRLLSLPEYPSKVQRLNDEELILVFPTSIIVFNIKKL